MIDTKIMLMTMPIAPGSIGLPLHDDLPNAQDRVMQMRTATSDRTWAEPERVS